MLQYAHGRQYHLRLGDASAVEITHDNGEIVHFIRSVSTDLPKTGDWVFVSSKDGNHALGWIVCRRITNDPLYATGEPDMYIVALSSAHDIHMGINAQVMSRKPNIIAYRRLHTQCIRLESPSPYRDNLLALARDTVRFADLRGVETHTKEALLAHYLASPACRREAMWWLVRRFSSEIRRIILAEFKFNPSIDA